MSDSLPTSPSGPPSGAAPGWPDLLATLLRGEPLESDAAEWAMGEILSGDATPAQIAAFAVALRAKGETAAEIAGLVRAMLAAAPPWTGDRLRAVDTCGTGGDRAHTVNISTMAAFVVRGAGVPVVKHGNRAASSRCGSADLLEALGVVVDLAPGAAARCFRESGAVFCFAPVWHAALRHTALPRSQLGVPTVFNVLGPLTNPAQPAAQAVGVGDARLAPVMAGVLAERGTDALVFRGEDGLDELSVGAASRVWVVRAGRVREELVTPDQVGVARAAAAALRGGDAAVNAQVARSLLAGEQGAVRDAVLLNAAAALVAYDGPGDGPIADQLAAALPRAAESIDSGAAGAALDDWVRASRAAAGT
jgi:anthranilate phosphoribosyltransferase